MTIANWCMLAAYFLPVATIGLANESARLPPAGGRYDNANPRHWTEGLKGWQQRANGAQMNGFEVLPLFVAAVLVAQQAHADQGRIDMLALSFIGLRVAYGAAYLFNLGLLRTLIWGAGIGACLLLFAMS